jgi:hypothetical protein
LVCHIAKNAGWRCLRKVLRRISGPKRNEVRGGCRKLYNYELYNDYQIKDDNMEGHLACKGKMENALRILVGKNKRKGPIRRPARTRNENIKMDLRETGIEGVTFIHPG